jgi:hypothetical protein
VQDRRRRFKAMAEIQIGREPREWRLNAARYREVISQGGHLEHYFGLGQTPTDEYLALSRDAAVQQAQDSSLHANIPESALSPGCRCKLHIRSSNGVRSFAR